VIETDFNEFVDYKVNSGKWSYVNSDSIVSWAKNEDLKLSYVSDEIRRYCPCIFISFVRSFMNEGSLQ
jgi:hypothetical protein